VAIHAFYVRGAGYILLKAMAFPIKIMVAYSIVILNILLFGKNAHEVNVEIDSLLSETVKTKQEKKALANYQTMKDITVKQIISLRHGSTESSKEISAKEKELELLTLILATREKGERNIFVENAHNQMIKERLSVWGISE
jgi:hypothetical protein